jgi:hypothetical protein
MGVDIEGMDVEKNSEENIPSQKYNFFQIFPKRIRIRINIIL